MKFNLDVVATLSHIDELSRVHNVIVTTGLADALKNAQAITLFAPENEAFDKLKGSTIVSALEDANKAKNILTYHVVPEKLMASNLRKEKSVTTMQGATLKIEEHRWLRHGLKVNDAVVKEADIEGTNGVIHIIDTVLVP
ncbi:MAG TPA: fasciclin domain-containing protein [Candidatus Acidoferrales bacterium]|nr:fasciclin domain-containing protein [Candidatus Acidoferrales bacterium]